MSRPDEMNSPQRRADARSRPYRCAGESIRSFLWSASLAPLYLKIRLLQQPRACRIRRALLESQWKQAKGVQLQNLQAYRKAVLSAFSDVEKALIALQKFTLQERLQREVVTSSRKAFDVAETQLRGGTVNLITVLQTQQTLFTAENNLVLVRLNKLLAASSLFQALGGGWTSRGTLVSLQQCG